MHMGVLGCDQSCMHGVPCGRWGRGEWGLDGWAQATVRDELWLSMHRCKRAGTLAPPL